MQATYYDMNVYCYVATSSGLHMEEDVVRGWVKPIQTVTQETTVRALRETKSQC